MNKYRSNTCGELTKKNKGSEVVLSGWINKKRDHGNLLFLDLRDNYGITQCIIDKENKFFKNLEKIQLETVIKIVGEVVERSPDTINNDIKTGETPAQVINSFIQELMQTGYLHNHARMYVASYVVHFRRVKWQAGAKFFMTHLLDGDLASNNFSWQWIASTFAGKPYIFNLENVHKYCHQTLSIDPQQNQEINGSYEEISARLFPNL